MGEFFRAGRAFVLSGGQVGKPHLFFCLTDTDPKTGQIVTVMMVSARPHTEKTVLIVPGDHPWVKNESNIDYGTARRVPISKLEGAVKQGRLLLEGDADAILLSRLKEGLLKSSDTPNDIKTLCEPLFAPKKPR